MGKYAIKCGTLIDGTGADPLNDAVVLIEGTEIAEVGWAGEVEVPQGFELVDAGGMTVMPGMIDCHVHMGECVAPGLENVPYNRLLTRLTSPPTLMALRAYSRGLRYLAAGFTSVRNMGDISAWDVSLKKAIEEGTVHGPRMMTSAGVVGMTAGHGDLFTPPNLPRPPDATADGVPEVIKATRERIRAGADFIKICTTGGVGSALDKPTWRNFTPEEVKAIADEAHALERKVAAHAQGKVGIINALEAGIDTIEHGVYMDEECIETMIKRGTILVPTFAVVWYIVFEGEKRGMPPWRIQKAKEVYQIHVENARRAYEAGVKIAMGTDASDYTPHGKNALELELMCKNLGMSPTEAIVATTKTAAEAIDLSDKVGTIEPGKLADLIVVDGNPLKDIRVLQDINRIKLVLKNGEIENDRRA